MEMTFSEIKELKTYTDDWRELIESALFEGNGFTSNYRLIHNDCIMDILVGELTDCPELLGSFRPWFIADNSDLTEEIVKALQESGKYEVIADYLVNEEFVYNMAMSYYYSDGYGPHFARYDGDEINIGEWWLFRIN